MTRRFRFRGANQGHATGGLTRAARLTAALKIGQSLSITRLAPALTPRQKALRAMRWGLDNTAAIHYRQSRPFKPAAFKNRTLPLYVDCSATVTQIHYAAGWKDPNANAYDGTGYTGTIRAYSPKQSLAECRVGDLIVYGEGTGKHVVAVYKAHPTNPTVWSHGQEAGPLLTSHATQLATHGSVFTCHGPRR